MTSWRSQMPVLEPCRSPSWARGGHLQTLAGHFLPSPTFAEPGERIELAVAGGDRLVAHCFPGSSAVVIYLFHGLGGFSHATYMQRTARLARQRGHTLFMFNHRGCGDGAGLAREPYHSGRAEDLSALIARGREMYPGRRHIAIGFSLSGNALLLLAARQRASVLPDAAIAVNAPINLARTAVLLRQGFNKMYDLDFMRQMRQIVRERTALEPSLAELRIPWRTTLTDFDDLYTAPYGGFKNREDYYATCSAARYMPEVVIPTVALTAKDDPFVAVGDYVTAAHATSAWLHVHIENEGGHMGYMSARPTPLGTRRWLDYALDRYLDALSALEPR